MFSCTSCRPRFRPAEFFLLAVASCWPLYLSAAEPAHFSVRVVGKGSPVLLLPGLSCNGSIWEPTIARLKDRHEFHVVSIAGFGGKPAVEGALLPEVHRELVAYIEDKRLDRPMLVGHSLGGFLALWTASSSPDSVGGVVVIDGVPFLPALQQPDATAAAMQDAAERIERAIASLDRDAFAAQNKMTLAMMVRDAKEADRIAAMASKSDPAAVGRAMRELMTTDLRPKMAALRCPVLVLVPATPAFPGLGVETMRSRYRDQFAGIPNCRIEWVEEVRHFIMIDDPRGFHRLLKRFLADPAASVRTRVEREADHG